VGVWSRAPPQQKKRSCQQGSGNVFADLGLRDAGEKQTRVRLAVAIQELKKLIKLIVSLFGSVPQWLITLLAMIDELLKLLQSVRLPALASALSRMHMQERILLARLNRENTAHDQVGNNEPNIESVQRFALSFVLVGARPDVPAGSPLRHALRDPPSHPIWGTRVRE
jgi:hypothetical protein